ncbi:MAG: hypothetical protein ACRYFS_17345 [Janthinobacterium lividum]
MQTCQLSRRDTISPLTLDSKSLNTFDSPEPNYSLREQDGFRAETPTAQADSQMADSQMADLQPADSQPEAPVKRTPGLGAFRSGLSYTDPAFLDAYDLIESQDFLPSSFETERGPVVCMQPVERLLDVYGDAAAAYYPLNKRFYELDTLCRHEQGRRTGTNPILNHLQAELAPVEEAYWEALNTLDTALTVERVVCIKEALELAGVTDSAFVDEICRCVIRGGKPGDGGNLENPHLENPELERSDSISASFTPSEAASRLPLVHRAMNARLEALLTKSAPQVFSSWCAAMEKEGKGRDVCPYWGRGLVYLAAALPLIALGLWELDPEEARPPKQEQRTERNRLLLIRLIYRGCKARGEF